ERRERYDRREQLVTFPQFHSGSIRAPRRSDAVPASVTAILPRVSDSPIESCDTTSTTHSAKQGGWSRRQFNSGSSDGRSIRIRHLQNPRTEVRNLRRLLERLENARRVQALEIRSRRRIGDTLTVGHPGHHGD